jgi:hypothetical protein
VNCKQLFFLLFTVTRFGSVEQSKAWYDSRDSVGCKYFEDIPVNVRHTLKVTNEIGDSSLVTSLTFCHITFKFKLTECAPVMVVGVYLTFLDMY